MDEQKQVSGPVPRFEKGRFLLIAGLGGRFTPETTQRIPELWERFIPHLGKVPGQVGRRPTASAATPTARAASNTSPGSRSASSTICPSCIAGSRCRRSITRCSSTRGRSRACRRPSNTSGKPGCHSPGAKPPMRRNSNATAPTSTPTPARACWRYGCRSRSSEAHREYRPGPRRARSFALAQPAGAPQVDGQGDKTERTDAEQHQQTDLNIAHGDFRTRPGWD